MKKFLLTSIAVLLLLTVFVSCAQDSDTVFKSIVHSNSKSKYACLSYAGEYNGTHYVLTKDQGIISFEFSTDGTSAKNIDTVDTGDFTALRHAYVSDNYLYGLDGFGSLFYIDLSKGGSKPTKIDGDYSKLANGCVVATDNTIYKLDGINKPSVEVAKNFSKIISNTYFLAEGKNLYEGSEKISDDVDSTIQDVVKVGNDYYITTYSGSAYYVFKVGNNTSVATLSYIPTASIAISDDTIIYKTKSAIYSVSISGEDKELTDGWASNLYTETTKINQFVKIGDNYYSLNSSGGMMFIDFTKNEATQIF